MTLSRREIAATLRDRALLLETEEDDRRAESYLRDVRRVVGGERPEAELELHADQAIDAWTFMHREAGETPAVWGRGDEILWAAGEPLLICAGPGLGKTTIAQQVALARLRGDEKALGYEVAGTDKPILYVNADRPRQSARSLARMTDPDEKVEHGDRFLLYPHAVPMTRISELALELDAGTIFIDTLGAVAQGDLGSDEVGQEVYRAMQSMIAAGLEVCVLHHDRKGGEKWRGLQEVYGSRWITAVMGSVVFLTGRAGGNTVKLWHLKQPVDEVGPRKVHHDHRRGLSYMGDWA